MKYGDLLALFRHLCALPESNDNDTEREFRDMFREELCGVDLHNETALLGVEETLVRALLNRISRDLDALAPIVTSTNASIRFALALRFGETFLIQHELRLDPDATEEERQEALRAHERARERLAQYAELGRVNPEEKAA